MSRVDFQRSLLNSIKFPGNWTQNFLGHLEFLGSKAIKKFPLLSHRIMVPELLGNKHPKECLIPFKTILEMVENGTPLTPDHSSLSPGTLKYNFDDRSLIYYFTVCIWNWLL